MTQAAILAASGSSGTTQGFKNKLINGDMRIDQRNAGASFSSSANGAYNLDRWYNQNNSGGTRFTVQQNSGGAFGSAVGFSNFLGVTSTSAYSIISQDVIAIGQKVEGYNTTDLNWGSANAKTITVSFWVRSSLTGTFGGSVSNNNGNRFYPFSYTISSANTWEYETVTIPGDVTGTWNTTTGAGIQLLFNLGTGTDYSGTAGAWTASPWYAPTGAVSVVGTSGATFSITGCQLEVGATATNFDFRDIGTELDLCQRYCFGFGGASSGGTSCVVGVALSSNQALSAVQFPVQMRGYPSLTVATPSNFYTNNIGANTNSSTISANTSSSTTGEFLATLVSSALTGGQVIRFFGNNSSLAIWSAEL